MTLKETVEAMYAAFQRGDIPFIVDQMAPEVLFRQPAIVPWGGDYHGPAGALTVSPGSPSMEGFRG